jgi:hypothetical protein
MKICFSQEAAEDFIDLVTGTTKDQFAADANEQAAWQWLNQQLSQRSRKIMVSALAWGKLPESPDSKLWQPKYENALEWLYHCFSSMSQRTANVTSRNSKAS